MKSRWTARTLPRVLLLAACASGLTGCKTTSWMPGSKLLAWNREPDPTMLASEPAELDYPTSPAKKYEPISVANMGRPTGTAASLAASRAGTPPGSGLAANANGYGSPYGGTSASAGATGYPTGPYQTGASSVAGTKSPYGGTYGSAVASQPEVALPNSVANNLGTPGSYPTSTLGALPGANPPSGSTAYPTSPGLPTQASTVGYSNGTGLGLPTSGTQPTSSLPTAGSPYPTSTAGGLPSATDLQASLPNLPVSGSAGGPSLGTSSPNTPTPPATSTPSGYTAPSAYKGATTLGGFSPGTTGRSTGYDFGSGPSKSGSTPGLPPNTASGTNPLLR